MSENDRIANDMGRVEKADNVFVPNKPPEPYAPWRYEVNNTPHICPVCNGKGLVPWDFYNIPNGYNNEPPTHAYPQPLTCRGCGGSGVIR